MTLLIVTIRLNPDKMTPYIYHHFASSTLITDNRTPGISSDIQLPNYTSNNRTLKILFPTKNPSVNLSIGDKCIIMYITRTPKTDLYYSLYNSSDVVIFKEGGYKEMLSYRPPGQRWVFYAREAVNRIYTNERFENTNDTTGFNYTMTYSVHSDVYMPYGKCVEVDSNPDYVSKKINDIVKSKTKLVAWFVSHCQTKSMRENYIRQLMSHIPVDVYGECGNSSCPKITCREDTLLQQYKFYLAFENTLNGEYITEKVWRCFENGLIPIVYGALDTYKMILPKGSYIDVTDFSSPQELANYILRINSNETLFRSFYSWQYSYKCSKIPIRAPLPDICDFLISAGKRVVNLTEEWSYPSTRLENASLYLQELGVFDITPRAFNLTA